MPVYFPVTKATIDLHCRKWDIEGLHVDRAWFNSSMCDWQALAGKLIEFSERGKCDVTNQFAGAVGGYQQLSENREPVSLSKSPETCPAQCRKIDSRLALATRLCPATSHPLNVPENFPARRSHLLLLSKPASPPRPPIRVALQAFRTHATNRMPMRKFTQSHNPVPITIGMWTMQYHGVRHPG